MIVLKKCIENINDYQQGNLPPNAEKLKAPATPEDMMKKSAPIMAVMCFVMAASIFTKNIINHSMSVILPTVLVGCLIGVGLCVVHEWLHGIVYPREAEVTIGKLKGQMIFVALASYPMKRIRFVIMCLLPFVLGIIPFALFIISPADNRVFNGFMFGMACVGMISPSPDVLNVILVMKQVKRGEKVMFYGDDVYKIS